MNFAEHITKNLKGVLGDASIKLEHPAVSEHGDYSSNIAMSMFSNSKIKKVNRSYGRQKSKFDNPRECAEWIVEQYEKLGDEVVEKVEVAGPGFVNFYLSKDALLNGLKQFDSVKQTSLGQTMAGRKVMVEYTDPNPFKEFHIGHLFTNAAGETLARLFESQGAEVKRANYQGDVGMHVAKAVWGIQKSGKSMDELEKESLEVRTQFLGEAYTRGANAFEEDEDAKKEITQLNKKVYELDEEVKDVYEKGRAWSLEAFERIYERLGTKFDFYYFERDTGKVGLEYVKAHMEDGVFVESDGAVIFPGEKYGLHSRVFINSQGLPTYEAKDLGLAETKYKDYAYDESYIVTGNEIKDYFRVIIKVLSLVNPSLGAKTNHVAHGMVRLPSGKMSSRTGSVIKGEWLLDESKDKLLANYPEMGEETANKVAVGAVKWALLKSQIGSDVTFDFDQSLSFEGDSGPYIQYTYARIQSVLGKAKSTDFGAKSQETTQEELDLLRYYYRYPEVVEAAAKNYSPNLVATYLFELASKYNHFYNTNRILEAEEGQRELRLALTRVTGDILKSGLTLLGIEAPERM